jgi:hypothetical protein
MTAAPHKRVTRRRRGARKHLECLVNLVEGVANREPLEPADARGGRQYTSAGEFDGFQPWD